jgi:uncharacterized protein
MSDSIDEIVARWQDWSQAGLEHLVLDQRGGEIVANSAVIGASEEHPFAVQHTIACDTNWRVRKAIVSEINSGLTVSLTSDGAGNWFDGSGSGLTHLSGAIDIDISATPFTNTLPIRRLQLSPGESAEILVAYVQVPGLTVSLDRQRYTCLDRRLYRYESLDSDFVREIQIDDNGLVTVYPGLFRRTL